MTVNTATTPQRDQATGAMPARHADNGQPPYKALKLPHERDESAARDAAQGAEVRPVIRQAEEDLAAGRRDTDCYGAAAPRFDRRQRKRR